VREKRVKNRKTEKERMKGEEERKIMIIIKERKREKE